MTCFTANISNQITPLPFMHACVRVRVCMCVCVCVCVCVCMSGYTEMAGTGNTICSLSKVYVCQVSEQVVTEGNTHSHTHTHTHRHTHLSVRVGPVVMCSSSCIQIRAS